MKDPVERCLQNGKRSKGSTDHEIKTEQSPGSRNDRNVNRDHSTSIISVFHGVVTLTI